MKTDHPTGVDWRKHYAFGLPGGSVRALLALVIASCIWGYLVLRPERDVPGYLRDLMFIILGHYFAVRDPTRADLPASPPPLYLPRGTIRLLLIAGFVAVFVLLYRREQLLPVDRHPGTVTLILVGGFLLGVLVKKLAQLWTPDKPSRWSRLIEDLKAALALLAALVLAVLSWDQLSPFLPRDLSGSLPRVGEHGPEQLASAVVGFYFGSR